MSASPKARRRLAIAGACALALIATALARPAAAASAKGPPWLKLDRVVAQPSWVRGVARLRVYVSAVTLQGGTIAIHGDKQWTLQLGSAKKKLPYIAGRFEGLKDDDLAVAILVCTSGDYAPELPKIKKAVAELIDGLPKDTHVQVLGYADEVDGDRRPSSKNHALSTLDELESSVQVSDLQLIKAVRYAVHGLRKVKTEPGHGLRKMIVVIGDGQDIDPTPERFRAIARRADREEIRIHTIAWSPNNIRKPMLGLAELSKRTYGTFRLVYTKDSFSNNLQQLWKEVEQQYVLTYFVKDDEIENKRVKVLAKEMVSNDLRLKGLTCGDSDCDGDHYCNAGVCLAHHEEDGHGILGWILYIVGGLVGLLVILVGVGFVLTRRQEKQAAAAALAQAAVEAQSSPHPNRIVPAGPQGGRVQPAGGPVQPPVAAPPAAQAAPAPAPKAKRKKRKGKAAPAAAPVVGSLYVLSGSYQGQTIPLRHGFRVGKAPDCDLVLTDDGYASSHHAHFEVDKGGGVTLVDDRSTNGTFVNGVRSTQTRLTSGMSIRVGATELRFLQG